jgi:hypothetical protein
MGLSSMTGVGVTRARLAVGERVPTAAPRPRLGSVSVRATVQSTYDSSSDRF